MNSIIIENALRGSVAYAIDQITIDGFDEKKNEDFEYSQKAEANKLVETQKVSVEHFQKLELLEEAAGSFRATLPDTYEVIIAVSDYAPFMGDFGSNQPSLAKHRLQCETPAREYLEGALGGQVFILKFEEMEYPEATHGAKMVFLLTLDQD